MPRSNGYHVLCWRRSAGRYDCISLCLLTLKLNELLLMYSDHSSPVLKRSSALRSSNLLCSDPMNEGGVYQSLKLMKRRNSSRTYLQADLAT